MLSKARIKNHFIYSSWMYILVVAASIFVWDLVYTATAYRPPEDKKLELYVVDNPFVQEEQLQAHFNEVQQSLFPGIERIDVVKIIGGGEQDYMTDIQLNTFVMANQGDVYIVGKERFKQFASLGAFLPLDDYRVSGLLQTEGLQVEKGILSYSAEESVQKTALFGIPLRDVPALQSYGIDTENSYIAILYNNGNDENAVRMLNHLIHLK